MFTLFRRLAPVMVIVILVACSLPWSTAAPDNGEGGNGGGATTQEPLQTATSTPSTPTATIHHYVTPGEGASPESSISDTISGDTAHQGVPNEPPGGDQYVYNLYERPFNAFTQDIFFPDLDIRSADLGLASPWMYVTIYLYGLRPETSTLAGHYGIEIDLNIDGRGDWLIMADAPLTDDWSVVGVRAWNDTNQNVGQQIACYADPPQVEDSYDLLYFDQGIGDDPDAAWARYIGGIPPAVQIAFKHTMINSDVYFMWNVWADQGLNQAEWFDYHDHFTYDEAGSPFSAITDYYPIKAIAELDNTCRWVYGFSPDGDEPCLCAGNVKTPTPVPARLGGFVWKDLNGNRVYDGAGIDGGLGMATVNVRYGACPGGDIAASTVTGAWGRYDVDGLVPGTYCVEVPPFGSFFFEPPNIQVTLAPGEFRDNLNFMLVLVGP
ncbi:MAG: SdrD B-like domain-containing protein [Chloroflexota bacterium]